MASKSLALLIIIVSLLVIFAFHEAKSQTFTFKEASVEKIRKAFNESGLTSRQLVNAYLAEINRLNSTLAAVIELNPDALTLADNADRERNQTGLANLHELHGIPILLKDSIATKDKMNTTAGSFALLGSVVPREAGVVAKLIAKGAIILGKASLTEWSHFRSSNMTAGWSARGGQGKNPYDLNETTCGSSSGSCIAVAANLVTVSLGSETDASILCPASFNSVVGIKPTVGLTSRAGVIPVTPRQDTIGPIAKFVADAVYVLDAIVGSDPNDNATAGAMQYIPSGGYKQYLNASGLSGKRIGIVRLLFEGFEGVVNQTFEAHFETMRQRGAVLVDNLVIDNIDEFLAVAANAESILMKAEFKVAINQYLSNLTSSPVRSLEDVIQFNRNNSDLEKLSLYLQDVFEAAQATNGTDGELERLALQNLTRISREGYEKLMSNNSLDAWVTPNEYASRFLAIGGFPGIIVPAGYDETGSPIGITFSGLKGYEPRLIEIAYGFEQATNVRRAPNVTISTNVTTISNYYDAISSI